MDADLAFCELCGTTHVPDEPHGLPPRPPTDQPGDEARDRAATGSRLSYADQLSRDQEDSGRSSYGQGYW
jgi:hypothetical protein